MRLALGGVALLAGLAGLALVLTPARPPVEVKPAEMPPAPVVVPSVPDVAVAQMAYDQAKALASGRHVEGLKIDDIDCSPIDSGRFLCQIRYVRDDERNGLLHFTVVTLQRAASGWLLTAGLCRGEGANNGR
jgi:hypothetical protein